MNRRNFFTVLPLGLAGFSTVARAQEPNADPNDVIASEGLIIKKDGKTYNVLAVPQESTQFVKLGKATDIRMNFNL